MHDPVAPAGLAIPDGFWDEIRALYATPPRAYHSFAHVRRVLEHVGATAFERPREAWLAAVFHDAIYDATAKDNEARSAEVARAAIARHGLAADADRVAALIELTARHGGLVPGDVDEDAARFLDCDMAVVGAGDAEFDAYDAGVAEEYRAVPPDAYRAGRRAFLEKVLGKPRIFLSDVFHVALDAKARANLRRAIDRLR
jgi:predicted metal-dependent HD superfamily phosphohydrolase